MQEDEFQPQAEPQTKDQTTTGGIGKWKPQKMELAVFWNTLLLIRLLQDKIDTDCVTSDKLGFFLCFFVAIYTALLLIALPVPHQVHHDPGIPKEGGFQWVSVLFAQSICGEVSSSGQGD